MAKRCRGSCRLTRISLRVGLRVLGGLATLAGLALVCQYQTAYPLRRTLHFPSALMRSEGGAAFSVSMSKFKNNYPWPVHRLSTVLESGKPLKIAPHPVSVCAKAPLELTPSVQKNLDCDERCL